MMESLVHPCDAASPPVTPCLGLPRSASMPLSQPAIPVPRAALLALPSFVREEAQAEERSEKVGAERSSKDAFSGSREAEKMVDGHCSNHRAEETTELCAVQAGEPDRPDCTGRDSASNQLPIVNAAAAAANVAMQLVLGTELFASKNGSMEENSLSMQTRGLGRKEVFRETSNIKASSAMAVHANTPPQRILTGDDNIVCMAPIRNGECEEALPVVAKSVQGESEVDWVIV